MFDEEPDGDPHGECSLEINRLRAELRIIKTLGEKFPDPYIPGATFAKLAGDALNGVPQSETGEGPKP